MDVALFRKTLNLQLLAGLLLVDLVFEINIYINIYMHTTGFDSHLERYLGSHFAKEDKHRQTMQGLLQLNRDNFKGSKLFM